MADLLSLVEVRLQSYGLQGWFGITVGQVGDDRQHPLFCGKLNLNGDLRCTRSWPACSESAVRDVGDSWGIQSLNEARRVKKRCHQASPLTFGWRLVFLRRLPVTDETRLDSVIMQRGNARHRLDIKQNEIRNGIF